MGEERGDDGPDHDTRADDYSSARIGAAAAFTLALVVLLVLDVAVPGYEGVVMGGALDFFVLPLLVDAWIDRPRRHGR